MLVFITYLLSRLQYGMWYVDGSTLSAFGGGGHTV